jgi:hypothetical protein
MHFSLYSFTLFRCVVDYYVYVPSVHSSLLVLQITFIDPHYHLFFLEVWSRRSYPLMRQWWSYSSLNISRCCRYSAHVSCSWWHFCTRHWTCIHRTWLWRLLNRSNTTHHAASFFPYVCLYVWWHCSVPQDYCFQFNQLLVHIRLKWDDGPCNPLK